MSWRILIPLSDDDEDDADPWLRPVWEDDSDETAAAEHAAPALSHRSCVSLAVQSVGATDTLLAPLAAAQDALARLDARAAAAPAALCLGLIARLAWREAAGWLAANGAWVHPTDLALRAGGLTGPFAVAALTGRTARALPHTTAAAPGPACGLPMDAAPPAPPCASPWTAAPDTSPWPLLAQEDAVTRALALARRLTALPRRHDPLADLAGATAWLMPLGVRALDPARFAAWQVAHPPPRPGRESPGGAAAQPPLLQAAEAARSWMDSGATDLPDALVALALAALRLARTDTLRAIPLPFWAAWPALGHPRADGLPRLRPAVARALAAVDHAPWPIAFLAFTAEAARAAARDLDRLQAAAEAGARLTVRCDRRARLPDALAAALAAPVLTAAVLARDLAVTPQAATRLLAALAAAGIVREVTGRARFRAFAV